MRLSRSLSSLRSCRRRPLLLWDVRPLFEDDHVEAGLGQLERADAPGRARADDAEVRHQRPIFRLEVSTFDDFTRHVSCPFQSRLKLKSSSYGAGTGAA